MTQEKQAETGAYCKLPVTGMSDHVVLMLYTDTSITRTAPAPITDRLHPHHPYHANVS